MELMHIFHSFLGKCLEMMLTPREKEKLYIYIYIYIYIYKDNDGLKAFLVCNFFLSFTHLLIFLKLTYVLFFSIIYHIMQLPHRTTWKKKVDANYTDAASCFE